MKLLVLLVLLVSRRLSNTNLIFKQIQKIVTESRPKSICQHFWHNYSLHPLNTIEQYFGRLTNPWTNNFFFLLDWGPRSIPLTYLMFHLFWKRFRVNEVKQLFKFLIRLTFSTLALFFQHISKIFPSRILPTHFICTLCSALI